MIFYFEIHLVNGEAIVNFVCNRWYSHAGKCSENSRQPVSLFTIAPRTTPRFQEFVVVAPLFFDYIVFSTLVNKSRYFVTMLLFRLTNRRCLASRRTKHGNAPNDQSSRLPLYEHSHRDLRECLEEAFLRDSNTSDLSNLAKVKYSRIRIFLECTHDDSTREKEEVSFV